jgi:hypothetical protein
MCNRSANGCRDDPRRNKSAAEWLDSITGKAWIAAGYTRGIPKDPEINLGNAKQRMQEWLGKSASCLAHLCEAIALTHELIPFTVCDVAQPQRKTRNSQAPTAIGGHLLLDTGAIGKSVVSKDLAKSLAKSRYISKSKRISHSLVTATNDKTLTNQEITFKIRLTSEYGAYTTPLIVDITAIVANININLVIDKATIKANNLAFHFASHFAGGELLDHIQQISREKLCDASRANPTKRVFIAHQWIKPQWELQW